MESISVNKFRDNLKTFVEAVASRHEPLRVTRRNGTDFVVISLEDWESEQETLYTLQNSSLMRQIRASQITHQQKRGYVLTQPEMDEILSMKEE